VSDPENERDIERLLAVGRPVVRTALENARLKRDLAAIRAIVEEVYGSAARPPTDAERRIHQFFRVRCDDMLKT
jgi:hypothetical protein